MVQATPSLLAQHQTNAEMHARPIVCPSQADGDRCLLNRGQQEFAGRSLGPAVSIRYRPA